LLEVEVKKGQEGVKKSQAELTFLDALEERVTPTMGPL
jgi:hypothetical protein